MTQIQKTLKVSGETVKKTVKRYIADQETFYKTNLKGRQYSEEKQKLLNEINELITESEKKKENIDIIDVNRIINKKY
jgi:hypothetical protein